MSNKNNYQEYLDKQLQDPEFKAIFAFSRVKAKLEIYSEKKNENNQKEEDKQH